MSSIRDLLLAHRNLVLIACVALGVRLTFVFPVHANGYTSDEREYVSMASRLAEGNAFVDSNGERSTRAPLFPFFLAILFEATGNSVVIAHIVGCILGTLVVVLGYLLCRQAWGDQRVALISAAVMAVYPGLVIYSGLLQTETLYCVFFLLALWYAYMVKTSPTSLTMVALGLASGLAALTRVVFLVFFPLLLLLVWKREWQPGPTAGKIVLSVAVFCLVLAPWTVRNYRLYHAVIPISSGGGNSLLTGNNPFATGTWRVEQGFEQWYDRQARRLNIPDPVALNEVERSSLSGRIAREYIVSHPLDVLRLMAKKAHIFFVYPITHSDSLVPLQAFAVGCDFLLLAGGIIGLIGSLSLRGQRNILYAALAFFSLTQIILHSEARFRLPLVPILSMFFGVGLVTVADRDRRRGFFMVAKNTRALFILGITLLLTYGVTAVLFLNGTL